MIFLYYTWLFTVPIFCHFNYLWCCPLVPFDAYETNYWNLRWFMMWLNFLRFGYKVRVCFCKSVTVSHWNSICAKCWCNVSVVLCNLPYWSPCNIYKITYVLEWRTVYAVTRGWFWCFFPELRSHEGNKHRNNTRMSAYTVHHKSTYIILFLTWLNESINYDKNGDLHRSALCLTRSVYTLLITSQSIADITMTRQLGRDYVNSDF